MTLILDANTDLTAISYNELTAAMTANQNEFFRLKTNDVQKAMSKSARRAAVRENGQECSRLSREFLRRLDNGTAHPEPEPSPEDLGRKPLANMSDISDADFPEVVETVQSIIDDPEASEDERDLNRGILAELRVEYGNRMQGISSRPAGMDDDDSTDDDSVTELERARALAADITLWIDEQLTNVINLMGYLAENGASETTREQAVIRRAELCQEQAARAKRRQAHRRGKVTPPVMIYFIHHDGRLIRAAR